MSNELDGCIGPIVAGIVIIAIVIFFIVYIFIPFLVAVASIGGVYGGVISIKNYGRSFMNNVIDK